MLKLAASTSLLLSLWSLATPAEACSCAAPHTEVFPMKNQVVPTSSKIFVLDGAQTLKASSQLKVFAAGKSVEFDAKEFTSAKLHGWVITPKKPLPASSKIKVTADKESFLFLTNKDTDTSSPTLTDYTTKFKAGAAPNGMCFSGAPSVLMTLDTSPEKVEWKTKPKIGTLTTSEFAIIKVWVDEAGKPIDYSKEPSFYSIAYEKIAQLSTASTCNVSNYDLSALEGKTIKVGLSVLDLSGNESKPVEKGVVLK